jgi:hypothetical protein
MEVEQVASGIGERRDFIIPIYLVEPRPSVKTHEHPSEVDVNKLLVTHLQSIQPLCHSTNGMTTGPQLDARRT